MPRVTMRVDEALGVDRPALTQARVRVHLRDGRDALAASADGARGYPENPASDAELDESFSRARRGRSDRRRRVLDSGEIDKSIGRPSARPDGRGSRLKEMTPVHGLGEWLRCAS